MNKYQAQDIWSIAAIKIDISQLPESGSPTDVFQILLQTFTIMSKSINTLELQGSDLIVVRPALNGVSGTDFSARQRAIQAGRLAMLQALPRLRAALEVGGR